MYTQGRYQNRSAHQDETKLIINNMYVGTSCGPQKEQDLYVVLRGGYLDRVSWKNNV